MSRFTATAGEAGHHCVGAEPTPRLPRPSGVNGRGHPRTSSDVIVESAASAELSQVREGGGCDRPRRARIHPSTDVHQSGGGGGAPARGHRQSGRGLAPTAAAGEWGRTGSRPPPRTPTKGARDGSTRAAGASPPPHRRVVGGRTAGGRRRGVQGHARGGLPGDAATGRSRPRRAPTLARPAADERGRGARGRSRPGVRRA